MKELCCLFDGLLSLHFCSDIGDIEPMPVDVYITECESACWQTILQNPDPIKLAASNVVDPLPTQVRHTLAAGIDEAAGAGDLTAGRHTGHAH